MKLITFNREIGAAPSHPVLGSDTAPTAPIIGAPPSNYIPIAYGERYPIQSIVLGYFYTGAGIAPTVEVGVYVYDEEAEQWWLIESLDLVDGAIQALSVPVSNELVTKKLTLALVPVAAGGEPNGVYSFAVGGSKNEASFYSTLDGIAKEASLLNVVNSTAATFGVSGTERSQTTPVKADGDFGRIEADRNGNAHTTSVIAHDEILELQGAVNTVLLTETALSQACDGLECHTADMYVYAQLRESPRLVSIDPADWTLGAGWAFAGTVATHTAGGGFVADLELTSEVLKVGVPYAIEFVITGQTAGTLTDKLGTAGGIARAASDKYMQILVVTVDGKVKFTPTADFDGSVDIANIWVVPPSYLPVAGMGKPFACSRVLAAATKAAPATKVASPTTAIVKALYYRRSGAVQEA